MALILGQVQMQVQILGQLQVLVQVQVLVLGQIQMQLAMAGNDTRRGQLEVVKLQIEAVCELAKSSPCTSLA